jgi:hypothetical protein
LKLSEASRDDKSVREPDGENKLNVTSRADLSNDLESSISVDRIKLTEPENVAEPENLSHTEISPEPTRDLERLLEPDGAKGDETLFPLDSENPQDCFGKPEIEFFRESAARSEDPRFAEPLNSQDFETETGGNDKSETEDSEKRLKKLESYHFRLFAET